MSKVVGITVDVTEKDGRVRLDVADAYAQCVHRAGGVPILLPPVVEKIDAYLQLCGGFVFTGGDDPRMEPFGGVTHAKATPLHPLRQAFETALLEKLETVPEAPVLGVCLGMQMMCLRAGGRLNQHMPDDVPTHARHWGAEHAIVPEAGAKFLRSSGVVASKHKQAVVACGRLTSGAMSDDGVIEAAWDPARPFYVGVQWHPERTKDAALGQKLFDDLVGAIRG